MILNKWNEAARRYEPYEVPDEWRVSCYEADMGAQVNCARCGATLPFGETYTSLQIHTPMLGFGYGVCEQCHMHELDERAM